MHPPPSAHALFVVCVVFVVCEVASSSRLLLPPPLHLLRVCARAMVHSGAISAACPHKRTTRPRAYLRNIQYAHVGATQTEIHVDVARGA